jgi:hypothetical protein
MNEHEDSERLVRFEAEGRRYEIRRERHNVDEEILLVQLWDMGSASNPLQVCEVFWDRRSGRAGFGALFMDDLSFEVLERFVRFVRDVLPPPEPWS